ncbi:phosphoribosyl-ATP pyrophosphohydrolase [Devosia sp. YIM 151766]|uniref:phosphoribosyl-ATP pyrophosphohydrolase n=1 Tax=Devosia sp. YIM 151766 TaxID=3017325 RepID=UPI00255C52E7|nr:phosphoribosyl-ATP pyrophosphohydrolase [Devosia sp. YIM 151766]WIY51710.1 phosphoribosyl-ATP pyrophosphohydrolase [Devosia sp. YIM 151766]
MSRSLADLTGLVTQVSDIYAQRNDIRRDDDWFMLKLQEELGELTAEHLRLSGRGRRKGQDAADIVQARDDEAADLLAMLLLYARHNDIDLEVALQRKWFRHLSDPERP